MEHGQLSGNNSKVIYFTCITCLDDTGLYFIALHGFGFKLFCLKLYFHMLIYVFLFYLYLF